MEATHSLGDNGINRQNPSSECRQHGRSIQGPKDRALLPVMRSARTFRSLVPILRPRTIRGCP